MHKTILSLLVAGFTLGTVHTAEAKSHHSRHDDHKKFRKEHRERTRTIYVIERNRPVPRVVYGAPGGYYTYRSGRRSYISQRYFTSYPARYYYPDGRRRVNVSFSF